MRLLCSVVFINFSLGVFMSKNLKEMRYVIEPEDKMNDNFRLLIERDQVSIYYDKHQINCTHGEFQKIIDAYHETKTTMGI